MHALSTGEKVKDEKEESQSRARKRQNINNERAGTTALIIVKLRGGKIVRII